MKKSLIALAALAATSAFAQSSVSVYGVADVAFASVNAKAKVEGVSSSSTTNGLIDGGVSSSRIGFKGTEDLGGGLKATFVLEQGFNMTNGAAGTTHTVVNGVAVDSPATFSREANVGLVGGFGTVQVGKMWTAFDDVRGANNDTFNANIAASNIAGVWAPYTANPNSSIKYTSPAFNGFTVATSYSLGADKTATTSASNIFSLGAQYVNGPVSVGLAYQSQTENSDAPAFETLNGATNKQTNTLVNGSYDFGVVKLVAGYQAAKQSGDFEGKARSYNLGVEVPLAANLALGAGYARTSYKAGDTTIATASGFSAALVYSLSKRTAAYAALNQSKFEDETSTDSVKMNTFAVGLKHAF